MRVVRRCFGSGVLAIAAVFAFVSPGRAVAQVGPPTACGSLASSYGPFDYRTNRAELIVVERFHFATEVEQLIRGQSGSIAQDLDYVLRASPNHHRALLAMARYGERLKTPHLPLATYSVECYFVRAITFKPDDTTVRMLYSSHLKKLGRTSEALSQLDLAASRPIEFGFTNYNLGLSYFDLSSFDKARRHAQLALEQGFPRTDLKEKLLAAGHWQSAPTASDAGAASLPASGASR